MNLMNRRSKVAAVLVAGCVFLSGCSVRMAFEGKLNTVKDAVTVGQTREMVMTQWGEPYSTRTLSQGVEDVYYLKAGYPALRVTRGIVYLLLDVGTLGLWELIGTPLEDFIQSKEKVRVIYGPDLAAQKIIFEGRE